MKEIDVGTVRWVMYTKSGQTIVENHDKGRTWKKVYKDNYGNIEALCIQVIPKSERYYLTPSPSGEYWTYEDMAVLAGQSRPTHLSRSICSKQYVNVEEMESYWEVITVHYDGNVERTIRKGSDINYENLNFINKEEKNWV